MTLKEILKIIDGRLLTEDANLDMEITCAFGSDLISDILMSTKEPTLLLTGLTNPQIIRVSDMIEVFGIVFVRGKTPPDELIEMAKDRDLPLISTSCTLYKTSGLLYQAGLRSCKI